MRSAVDERMILDWTLRYGL